MTEVRRYRKRPVQVEALRHTRQQDTFAALRESGWGDAAERVVALADGSLEVETPNGPVALRPGEWVVRGVAGEVYPCRNDIFERTYEPDDPDFHAGLDL